MSPAFRGNSVVESRQFYENAEPIDLWYLFLEKWVCRDLMYVYTMSLYVSSPGQKLNELLPLIGIRCSPSSLTVSHFNFLLPNYSWFFLFFLSIHQHLTTLSCEVTFHSSSTAQSKEYTKYIYWPVRKPSPSCAWI
jgi:hypothetical protein